MTTGWRDRARVLLQYIKFALVGGLATLTHVAAFAAFNELTSLTPLLANFAAFGTAFSVSFFGHLRWTFAQHDVQPAAALGRFAAVALVGLSLNTLIVYLITDVLAWSYIAAIPPMATLVPISTFVLSKYWAFAMRTAR
ncbi:MAG: GtrA family protein [Pseudomonadota bacterium]